MEEWILVVAMLTIIIKTNNIKLNNKDKILYKIITKMTNKIMFIIIRIIICCIDYYINKKYFYYSLRFSLIFFLMMYINDFYKKYFIF